MGLISSNSWLKYFDRSYQQIKAQVLTTMQIRVPEITDHSESNLFVKMVSIWAGISEMLGYYIDNQGREAFIGTCRLYKSAVQIAASRDYRIRAYNPASVTLTFSIEEAAGAQVTIPTGTVISDADDEIKFSTTEDAVIAVGQTTVSISATQTETITDLVLGNSSGEEDEVTVIDDKVADGSVLLKVSNVAWENQDTLAWSGSLDTHYKTTVNDKKEIVVITGNGANGKIPSVGAELKVNYKRTQGEVGNVEAGTLNTIVSDLTLPEGVEVSVTNLLKASGGLGVEDLATLKKKIPLAIRTQYRAVTDQDFIDLAELATGVSKAGMEYLGGKNVIIYVVPEGGGVASQSLLDSVSTYFDTRKIITTSVEIYAAGEVHVVHTIEIRVKAGHNRAVTIAAARANLIEFMSYDNQKIRGRVEISDIYEVIETTEGVESSKIVRITPVPYARPLNVSSPQLNWVRTVNPASNDTIRWKLVMIASDTFELFRANVFLGQFSVGSAVVTNELNFTVSSNSYSVNDTWEFVTYKYSGTVQLDEPSIPVSNASDIVLIGQGGLE